MQVFLRERTRYKQRMNTVKIWTSSVLAFRTVDHIDIYKYRLRYTNQFFNANNMKTWDMFNVGRLIKR